MTNLDVIAQVLANEVTCRVFLRRLIDKGVGISVPIETLSHQECVAVAARIYAELLQREKEPAGE